MAALLRINFKKGVVCQREEQGDHLGSDCLTQEECMAAWTNVTARGGDEVIDLA